MKIISIMDLDRCSEFRIEFNGKKYWCMCKPYYQQKNKDGSYKIVWKDKKPEGINEEELLKLISDELEEEEDFGYDKEYEFYS